jgi:ribosome-binding protein aMBF1 (putative translation factor)
MGKETDYIVQSLFDREHLKELTVDELKEMTASFPYSSILHLLYTKKLKANLHIGYNDALMHTSLFFNQPQWLAYQMHDEAEIGVFRNNNVERSEQTLKEEQADEQHSTEVQHTINSSSPEEEKLEIPIDPYHTVDYFASQGIKLSKEEQKDELSKKVQSFTAWLRTIKRLQPAPETTTYKNIEEIFGNQQEEKSQDKNEVFTEAMAEVYLKQGLREKAIEIYHKLSLQNPANHHIFAAKIQQIKENKL